MAGDDMSGVPGGPASTTWEAGPPLPPRLRAVLEESRGRGLLGTTDLETQVAHAHGFAGFLAPGARVLDLGSGGGLPGLALVVGRSDLRLTLLDSAARRTRMLEWAIRELGAEERASVLHARAEVAGGAAELRESFDAVVARSFGPPAVTAECARPFLRNGGVLVVSEPPSTAETGADERWPSSGLAGLGLEHLGHSRSAGFGFVLLRASGACPEGLPRRSGMPAKRPAF